MTVSLLGDGVYTVALAWQVYELSGVPTALSLVALAWTIPQLVLLLVGGAVADRVERRRVLLTADALQALAIGTIGVLAVTGALRLWQLFLLVPLVGAGEALFAPAYAAIVPELVSADEILQANALNQISRPLMLRVAGPALGGVLIGLTGAGWAFVLDALTFGASTAALLAIARRPALRRAVSLRRSLGRDVTEGLRYVASEPWLLGTMVASSLGMLFFLGPVFVLMPFVVKNLLGGSSAQLGLVFAAGGVSAIGASLVIGGRAEPRRPLTVVYVAWAFMCLQLVGYGVARSLWTVVLASFAGTALLVTGQVLWSTLLQRNVPSHLLARVAGLDSLLSFGLVPVSYAATGPVAAALGVRTTLIAAGSISAGILAATYLLFRSVRDAEHGGVLVDATPSVTP
jgi:DHA3 family tetracycline resistance protein-like MFS transporter